MSQASSGNRVEMSGTIVDVLQESPEIIKVLVGGVSSKVASVHIPNEILVVVRIGKQSVGFKPVRGQTMTAKGLMESHPNGVTTMRSTYYPSGYIQYENKVYQ